MKQWIKPEIKTEELELRALLGDNGWYDATTNGRYLLAATNLPQPYVPPNKTPGKDVYAD